MPKTMLVAVRELRAKQQLVSSLIKPASQLRGLTFGNRIDTLLRGGLIQKTLTFLYGINANSMMNILCSNAIRIFGGKAIFIDGANSFDPYLIVQSNFPKTSERESRDFIKSIIVSRAFTCYQLRKLVTSKLVEMISNQQDDEEEDQQIRSVFVSGISSLFSEQDNTQAEITRIELLMAQALHAIASDKNNGVLFVVASSNESSTNFMMKSDTAIRLFLDQKNKNRKKVAGIAKATLMKHYTRNFETVTL